MNATKRALVQRYVAEHVRIYPFEWWHQALMVIGAFTVLLVFGAALLYLATKDEPEDDPDIHPAVMCTCPSPKCSQHPHNFNSNHVGVLSISDFKRVPTDPKRGA